MVPTGLRLPDQEEFQLFTSDHSFERYDLRFKELFGFERAVKRDIRDDDDDDHETYVASAVSQFI